MVKVFASTPTAIVQLAHEVLVQAEIGCVMRGENLGPGAGERPELRILNARQEAAAWELVKALEAEDDPRGAEPDWLCVKCGESVEA